METLKGKKGKKDLKEPLLVESEEDWKYYNYGISSIFNTLNKYILLLIILLIQKLWS